MSYDFLTKDDLEKAIANGEDVYYSKSGIRWEEYTGDKGEPNLGDPRYYWDVMTMDGM